MHDQRTGNAGGEDREPDAAKGSEAVDHDKEPESAEARVPRPFAVATGDVFRGTDILLLRPQRDVEREGVEAEEDEEDGGGVRDKSAVSKRGHVEPGREAEDGAERAVVHDRVAAGEEEGEEAGAADDDAEETQSAGESICSDEVLESERVDNAPYSGTRRGDTDSRESVRREPLGRVLLGAGEKAGLAEAGHERGEEEGPVRPLVMEAVATSIGHGDVGACEEDEARACEEAVVFAVEEAADGGGKEEDEEGLDTAEQREFELRSRGQQVSGEETEESAEGHDEAPI